MGFESDLDDNDSKGKNELTYKCPVCRKTHIRDQHAFEDPRNKAQAKIRHAVFGVFNFETRKQFGLEKSSSRFLCTIPSCLQLSCRRQKHAWDQRPNVIPINSVKQPPDFIINQTEVLHFDKSNEAANLYFSKRGFYNFNPLIEEWIKSQKLARNKGPRRTINEDYLNSISDASKL